MLSSITAREVILRFGNGSSSEGKHPNLFTASLTNPNSNRVSPLGVEKREQLAPGMNQSEMSCPSASTAPATCSLSASPAPCSVTRKARRQTHVHSRTTLLLMLRAPPPTAHVHPPPPPTAHDHLPWSGRTIGLVRTPKTPENETTSAAESLKSMCVRSVTLVACKPMEPPGFSLKGSTMRSHFSLLSLETPQRKNTQQWSHEEDRRCEA